MKVGEMFMASSKNTYVVGIGNRGLGYITIKEVEPRIMIHGELRMAVRAVTGVTSPATTKRLSITDMTGQKFVCRSIDRASVSKLYESSRTTVYVYIKTNDNKSNEKIEFARYKRDVLCGEYGLSNYAADRVGQILTANTKRETDIKVEAFKIEFEDIYTKKIFKEIERYVELMYK